MNLFKVFLHVFVYVVIICPIIIEVLCQAHGDFVSYANSGHLHKKQLPCAKCPRHGVCVPRVRCPAHLRPGSHNPACHLSGEHLGICCFTGGRHAAEHEQSARAAVAIDVDVVKSAHNDSADKITMSMNFAESLLANYGDTVVNVTSPEFAHYLSLVSHDKAVKSLGYGGLLNLYVTKELKSREAITDDQLKLGFTDHTDGAYCPTQPVCPSPPSRFRSFGGECNNPAYPAWGAANTGYERLLPPDYSDGVWAVRGAAAGARALSDALLPDAAHASRSRNQMLAQLGQFVAHDVTAGVPFTYDNGSFISCCASDGGFLPADQLHWACLPIEVSPTDSFFSYYRRRCLSFTRAQVAPESDCSVGYAKQMNGATHFIDLSHLYGKTPEKVASLRAPGGMLKTTNDYGRQLPPISTNTECPKTSGVCFETGDNHGNQIISLTAMHTLFTREHNRIAESLTRLNPGWNDETIFQETRRIVQAELHNIVYTEFLPLVLGPRIMQKFGLSEAPGYSASYDPLQNPSILSEFATAAFRFGHSLISGKLVIPYSKTGQIDEIISISEVMFEPSRMRLRHFFDRLLMGLCWQPMESVDPFVSETLTRYLFRADNPYGLDLGALNIQRGRDYGLRSYNHYRRLCGLDSLDDFSQFSYAAGQRLSSVYASTEDIDLWIGGLMEEPVEGGIVGETFANIIADQFVRLRNGDRYYYKYGPDVNPGAFNPSQLAEIEKVTLARIICDNSDGIDLVAQSPNAFLRPDLPSNTPVYCNSTAIPSMDLSRFKIM